MYVSVNASYDYINVQNHVIITVKTKYNENIDEFKDFNTQMHFVFNLTLHNEAKSNHSEAIYHIPTNYHHIFLYLYGIHAYKDTQKG